MMMSLYKQVSANKYTPYRIKKLADQISFMCDRMRDLMMDQTVI